MASEVKWNCFVIGQLKISGDDAGSFNWEKLNMGSITSVTRTDFVKIVRHELIKMLRQSEATYYMKTECYVDERCAETHLWTNDTNL